MVSMPSSLQPIYNIFVLKILILINLSSYITGIPYYWIGSVSLNTTVAFSSPKLKLQMDLHHKTTFLLQCISDRCEVCGSVFALAPEPTYFKIRHSVIST